MTDVEGEIHKMLNGSGLTPTPPPQQHETYGAFPGSKLATETAQAIEEAVEAAIAQHYRAADNLKELEKQVRESADSFAARFREYSKGFAGHVTDFINYAHEAKELVEKHSVEFEARIAKLVKRS